MSGAAAASMVYDGDGHRVKTTINGVTTVYVGNYYEKTGSAVKKHYYAGGARVALRDSGTLRFLLGDHPSQAQDRPQRRERDLYQD